jgi:type II secretory pathway pseudopilin PulG
MKIYTSHIRQSLLAILVVLFLVSAAMAQTTESQTKNAEKKALDKKALLQSQYTEEQLKDIQRARDEVMTSPATCTSTTPIAFSTSGTGHRGSGSDALMGYSKQSDKIITNESGGAAVWIKPATYVVPCSGLYVLTLSFQKDAYYPPATTDDVMMYFTRNLDPGDLISYGYGWAGEGSPRGTGAYTVTARLNQGDFINTWSSGGGATYTRHLIVYYFSVFRIAP